ncbi:unnamed protein product [Brassicogethes aeneus]|uniref:RRM domain-containing protein n=1 Tax=Brassicogethes aeneus TaxID=1431903 RepID=A0A9P0B5F6_BRAAE|nr:unnamed protein product [Brassicogethes aeneus]
MSDRRARSRSPYEKKASSSKERKHRSYSRSPSGYRTSHRRYSQNGSSSHRDNPKPSRCLGIFGLSHYTTEDELYNILRKFGPIEKVQLVLDVKSGRSRGFSFAYFENVEDAQIAKKECSGMRVDGKTIRVDYSITARAHTPTPGVYMGKSTSYERAYYRGERVPYRGYRYYQRSPSPYYRRTRRYERSTSRSYSPRR